MEYMVNIVICYSVVSLAQTAWPSAAELQRRLFGTSAVAICARGIESLLLLFVHRCQTTLVCCWYLCNVVDTPVLSVDVFSHD